MISRPAKLRREHYSLAIEQEQTAFVPFEDIAVIMLNHREISLTHPVLSACGEYGISLFATGDTHHPSGVFLPFMNHSRATRWLRFQLNIPRPVAKQTWTAIVRRKIANQAACLKLCGIEGADRLAAYVPRVVRATLAVSRAKRPRFTSLNSLAMIFIAARNAGSMRLWITVTRCFAAPSRAGLLRTAFFRRWDYFTRASRMPLTWQMI